MPSLRPPARSLPALTLLVLLVMLPASSRAVVPPDHWHWIRIHGHRMYYAAEGSGRTLVLLHGGGDSGEHSFEQQIEMLSLHHRIIAPDQVGQGHTPDIPAPLSYTHMMQDTVAVIELLRLHNVDVMGFSDGGIIALMLAARHPYLVRRLVISGVNIAPEGLTDEQRDELRASQAPTPKTIDEKLAQLWLTSPTKDELSLELLATIHKPVLVISGDRDAIRLEHTLEIYHALPDAELCILPGTDHGTFSGRPEWLNPILTEFLDRP
jgi:pimeloyl-ACP methyl ester carboxylesterase